MNEIFYSAGKIITLWRVIFFVKRYGDSDVNIKEVYSSLNSSGYLGGTVPIKESIQIGIDNKFIKCDAGKISISDYCENELIPVCEDENPNIVVLRKILSKIIIGQNYHWLFFFDFDYSKFKVAIPLEWLELLESVKLFEYDDVDVEIWWSNLLQSFQSYNQEKTKTVGTIGEYITLNFEKDRLRSDGYSNPERLVLWVSQISDTVGYDIKSKRGSFLRQINTSNDNIQIEVKSSVLSNLERFRFFVSRNEWDTAINNIDSYYFYCWPGIDINNQTCSKGPYIIPAKRIKDFFPKDIHESIKWSECKVIIDLSSF